MSVITSNAILKNALELISCLDKICYCDFGFSNAIFNNWKKFSIVFYSLIPRMDVYLTIFNEDYMLEYLSSYKTASIT